MNVFPHFVDLDLLAHVQTKYGAGVGMLVKGLPDEVAAFLGLDLHKPVLACLDEYGAIQVWNADEGEEYVVFDSGAN